MRCCTCARRATAARWRCSRGTRGSARRPARRRVPVDGDARTAGTRRGAGRPRSCRCPDRPARRGICSSGARITTSCSAWMVATISRIAPVRAAPISASTGSGMPVAARRVGIVELLVEVGGQSPSTDRESAAMAEAERVDAGGPVERRGDRRSPVDDHGIVGIVFDVPAADVPAVGVLVGDPPEEVAGTGLRRSSSASATVTSTYSEVISSADADGSTAWKRRIIASRQRGRTPGGRARRASSGKRSACTGRRPSCDRSTASTSATTTLAPMETEDDCRAPRTATAEPARRGTPSKRSCWSRRSRSTACAACTELVAARHTAGARPAGRPAAGAVRRARLSLRHRRLVFLKHPDVVARRPAARASTRRWRRTLQACDIAEARWPSFAKAFASLNESEIVRERRHVAG